MFIHNILNFTVSAILLKMQLTFFFIHTFQFKFAFIKCGCIEGVSVNISIKLFG